MLRTSGEERVRRISSFDGMPVPVVAIAAPAPALCPSACETVRASTGGRGRGLRRRGRRGGGFFHRALGCDLRRLFAHWRRMCGVGASGAGAEVCRGRRGGFGFASFTYAAHHRVDADGLTFLN